MNKTVKNLVFSGLCLALCMVLPLLTGQIPEIGNMLCPMHIPVFLCGFISGPWYAAGVGIIAPILRFFIFSKPPLPTALAMCCELMSYGLISGLMYKLLPKKLYSIYISLITAMLGGRVVWGIAKTIIMSGTNNPFTMKIFITEGFLNAVPGIVLQLVLIPVIIAALEKAGILKKEPLAL